MEIVWVTTHGTNRMEPMAVPPLTFVTTIVKSSDPIASTSAASDPITSPAGPLNDEMTTCDDPQNMEAGLSEAAEFFKNVESPLNIDVTPPN